MAAPQVDQGESQNLPLVLHTSKQNMLRVLHEPLKIRCLGHEMTCFASRTVTEDPNGKEHKYLIKLYL